MSFKVIDGDGPGKEERDSERQREWAKDEFSGAIRELAANILRVRGAGKAYELLVQMKVAIDSAIKYRDLHDYWPSDDVIANALRLEDEMESTLERGRAGTLAQEHIDRWAQMPRFVTPPGTSCAPPSSRQPAARLVCARCDTKRGTRARV